MARWLALITAMTGCTCAQTVELRQTSVPLGIINQTTAVPLNSVAATLTAAETSTTYTFCYWTLNAVRWADPSGGAQNPATFTAVGAVDAVAKYVPTTEDKDSDGLPDWWEYRYLGDLSQAGADNPDGDAFINSDEYLRGLHPKMADLFDYGSATRRRSDPAVIIQNRDQFVRLTESSTPPGVIQRSRVVPKGVSQSLTNPPTPYSSYSFTGWLYNGARFDRPTDNQPITVTPNADLSLVARYTRGTDDMDFDGLLDWKEWLWFDHLLYDNASDPDADSFNIAEEETRGFTTLAADELVQGGLTRRKSAAFYVDTTGRIPFRQASAPATILDQTDYLPFHSLVTVPDKSGHTAGSYLFTWWDLDGQRQQDPSGAAVPWFKFTLNLPSVATAHYVDPTVDSDYDGIKDWQEWTYFGALTNNAASDSDGDGYSFDEELKRGQAPQVADVLAPGGIDRRRSNSFFVDVTHRLSLRTTSNPVSILNEQEYLPAGSLVTIPDKSASAPANYQFSWWTRNSVRQADPSGAALRALLFTINTDTHLVGNYIDPSVDTDGDGIKDWYEWTYFGTLAKGATDDSDADGFTFTEELARNQAPQVLDAIEQGGITRRRSLTATVDPVVLAAPPVIGALRATNITATTAKINALINPMSAATAASFEYGQTTAFGTTVPAESILNGFIADSMSAALTSLRPDTLYYFRVTATNALGTTTSNAATFRTLPSRTGYDQWALVYSITDPNGDADGDGVRNLAEYAFGMHPRVGNDLWRLPVIELIDGRFRLSVTEPQNVTDVIYGAQWSHDFLSWTAIPDSGSGRAHEFLTPANQIGAPKMFVRWIVRLAP